MKESDIAKLPGSLLADPRFTVGNDLVFIPEFTANFNNLFKNKVYTDEEIAYCQQFDDSMQRFASTWAAKEAVYKAIKQIDAAALGPKRIEISRQKIAGQPTVRIRDSKTSYKISLTISHDGDYAWAIALIDNS